MPATLSLLSTLGVHAGGAAIFRSSRQLCGALKTVTARTHTNARTHTSSYLGALATACGHGDGKGTARAGAAGQPAAGHPDTHTRARAHAPAFSFQPWLVYLSRFLSTPLSPMLGSEQVGVSE